MKVKIEGIVNTTALQRGEVAEVERTESVDNLIAAGYVREVVEGPTVEAAPSESEPDEPTAPAAPPRNGTQEAWYQHAVSLGLPAAIDTPRDELIAMVDEHGDGEQ